ncbi:MAG TPA: 50S ribosomal protein L22 [Candidatus Borkfalkia excrementigallinarum]|uniref:Large ribosomal subunit protein uL22 n=1 Tax=Candidatus Borkfalkia excrementigallinarum TaxID=2838506 RepID=A0A9D2CTA9_9FIRM|nr:50S ribosomal protein L22 [Candidatus Borkfalkia excrementigallinarum]
MAKNTREKAKKIAENKDRRPYATARHIRMSPYKVRRALTLIRGKSVNEAAAILEYATIISAEPVRKVLLSAAANAEHNYGMDRGDLIVAEAFADQGPTLKRMNPVSKGRAHSILKRTSHITVVLDVKSK